MPIVGDGTPGSMYRPKYNDDSRITAWSGTVYDVPSDAGLPFNGPHYVVRFYADVDQDLVDLAGEHNDAYAEGVDASQNQIANWLNDHFGMSRDFSEWGNNFAAGADVPTTAGTGGGGGWPDIPLDARPQPSPADADDSEE